jgi:hypothetical protein
VKRFLDDETQKSPGSFRSAKRLAVEHPRQLRFDSAGRRLAGVHGVVIIMEWPDPHAKLLKRGYVTVTAAS